MNIILVGIVFILILINIPDVIAISEEEKYVAVVNFFDSITNTYAYLGDTTKMQTNNRPSGPAGDMVTLSGGMFTVYMIVQGWPAEMCKPGQNPNIIGGCFVDEGVDLENTLIYSAGISNAGYTTSASFSAGEKRLVFDDASGSVTVELPVQVYWTKKYCCTKDGNSWTVGETWYGLLSQTIPAPVIPRYNKTQNMMFKSSYLTKLVNTALVQEEFGFGMKGYIPSYSRSDVLKGILMKNITQKNESVNIALSYYEKYYVIKFDENRQIYYGELVNVSDSPKIEIDRARIFYDYSNKTVSSLQVSNATVLTDFWIMSPFGRKNVTVNVMEITENDTLSEAITPISVLLTFVVLFFAMKRLIFRR